MGHARGRTCARKPGESRESCTLDVLVQPRASRARIGPRHDGRIKVAVTAAPVDGEANAAVIELVADVLGVARGAVTVVSGVSSRRKTLRVQGVSASQLEELVGALVDGTDSGDTGDTGDTSEADA